MNSIRLIPQLASRCIIFLAAVCLPLNSAQAYNVYLKSFTASLDKPSIKISDSRSISIEQIKQVAQQQNTTLVQYSIINDDFVIAGKKQTQASQLLIWVVQPTGKIVSRQVDLKPLSQKQNTSLSDLIVNVLKTQQLQQLYQLLIQPIADLLPTQPQEHVTFIPQGELFLVPFAALQDTNGKYLIEQYAIATAPSIQVLDLLYQRKQRIKEVGKDVLIVSDSGPGTEAEAKAIARIFHNQAMTGNTATKNAVVQRMSQAKIIHFATTALPNHQETLGIALTPSGKDDGWLTAEEIMDLHLQAELVVLSGCNTLTGKITSDGIIGLPRSFFAAGVSTVIGSLWIVSDKETAFLMTEFYQELTKKPDKAEALRQAMLTTIKKYPNSLNWAAFTLIGESE